MGRFGEILLVTVSGLSFIFMAACLGGNVWTKAEIKYGPMTFEINGGLWKQCRDGKCTDRDRVEDWFKAVRAFAVLACIASCGAIVMSLLGIFTEKIKGYFASIFFAGAAGCMLISLSVFAGKVESTPGGSIGWSYIIGWIGVVASGFGCIFGFFSAKI